MLINQDRLLAGIADQVGAKLRQLTYEALGCLEVTHLFFGPARQRSAT